MKQITQPRTPLTLTACLLACGLIACTASGTHLADTQLAQPTPEPTSSVIVQGQDMDVIKQQVLEVGGTVTHELAIIHAVGAKLTATQRTALQELDPNLRIYEDAGVRTSGNGHGNGNGGGNGGGGGDDGGNGSGHGNGSKVPYTHYPSLIHADWLHAEGITGYGVTIAVLDTGMGWHRSQYKNHFNQNRLVGNYDAIADRFVYDFSTDENGHGSHVSAIALDSSFGKKSGKFNGIAPDAETIERSAHSLKSSSATLGALELAQLCKQLEQIGREATTDQAAEVFASLEMEFDRVRRALSDQWQQIA